MALRSSFSEAMKRVNHGLLGELIRVGFSFAKERIGADLCNVQIQALRGPEQYSVSRAKSD